MMRATLLCGLSLVVGLSWLAGCSTVQRPAAEGRLYDGFGGYTRPMTTRSSEAQALFDQGMQLMYGFNHDEAIRSFAAAASADPSAAMPWWGIAYSHGININDPAMSAERSRAAREAADEALSRIDGVTAVEAALIRAVSTRYEWPAPEDRKALDEAYAAAMGAVFREFPGDPDVGSLYAESLMNLQPWDLWTKDGEPKGRALEVVSVLEGVMATHPTHPAANHFYIHAVEASQQPGRAVPSADRLRTLVPGSGHLVHMPSHIDVRVGRYADAAAANEAAIAVDRAYLKIAPPPGLYAMYYAHNLHFLAYASMMTANYEKAMGAARAMESEMPEPALREFASYIEGVMPTSFHVMVRFGRWDEILSEPAYADWRLVSNAVRRYARAIAYSAKGMPDEARSELALFDVAVSAIPSDWNIINNKVHTVLPIARLMIEGETLWREGLRDEAYGRLRAAAALEDDLVYDEPPAWMIPVRHALGALLVAAERYEEAEGVYREDLERNPGNGWAMTGLRWSLLGQGRADEAAALDGKIAEAFASGDTLPGSSCYCEPGSGG